MHERQSSFRKLVRKLPEKSLPPDLVMAFSTPPEKRPN